MTTKNKKAVENLEKTLTKSNVVDTAEQLELLVERVKKAQKIYSKFSQEQVDKIFKAAATAADKARIPLAKMAVEETGMGVLEDKIIKNHFASEYIYNKHKNAKTCGIIKENKADGIKIVAEPLGVIAGIVPTTNPTSTAIFKSLIALKTRNAIIFSPHPRATKSTIAAAKIVLDAAVKAGAPEDIIGWIDVPSIELSSQLMKHRSISCILATGGPGMVTAAYSSGNPALGVGPGNVQVIMDRGIDYEDAVKKIIIGRTFDNGIICSGEQAVFIPKEDFNKVLDLFRKNGVFVVEDEASIKKFADTIFPENGPINRKIVGQSVQTIAKLADVEVPEGTRMILIKARAIGKGNGEPLCREKMCPVMITAPYDTFEDAIKLAQSDLEYEGKGHTASIHSNDMEHVRYAGENLTVSRLIVNQSSSTGAGGSLYNGFAPTTTLGCGSWGNNSISENLNYTHLINVSQIGLYNKDKKVPTDEEIWA